MWWPAGSCCRPRLRLLLRVCLPCCSSGGPTSGAAQPQASQPPYGCGAQQTAPGRWWWCERMGGERGTAATADGVGDSLMTSLWQFPMEMHCLRIYKSDMTDRHLSVKVARLTPLTQRDQQRWQRWGCVPALRPYQPHRPDADPKQHQHTQRSPQHPH